MNEKLWKALVGGRHYVWLAPLLILVVVLLLQRLPLAEQLENVTVDWRFKQRAADDRPFESGLVVIGIDEKSIAKLGRWPWPRSTFGALLDWMAMQRKPEVVAFDLVFSEADEEAQGDEAFVQALELYPGAIVGAATDQEGVYLPFAGGPIGKTTPIAQVSGDISRLDGGDSALTPISDIADVAFTGFVNCKVGADGVRRGIPVVVRSGDSVYPSFALMAVMRMEGVPMDGVAVELGREVRLSGGNRDFSIPIDEQGRMWINHRGNRSQVVPFLTVVRSLGAELEGTGEWPKELPDLTGKLVVVGQLGVGLTDFGPTPLDPMAPLVLVQATAMDNILSGDYLVVVDSGWIWVGWWLLVCGSLWLLRSSPVWLAVAVPLAVALLYVVGGFQLFASRSLQIPLFWPVFGFAVAHGGSMVGRLVAERRAKGRIRDMFGTYVAPTVVARMIESGEQPQLGGEEIEITPFFSDIQGFSSFSELLTPKDLVELMCEYLTEMTAILQFNGGTLDKFIGDAIVGMFGAPLHFDEHAASGCAAAIEMQRRQAELAARWKADGRWPEEVQRMRTRIGLNSGLAVVGNIGSLGEDGRSSRFNYTMIGDTVNLAARCESGSKLFGVYTMVTEATRKRAIDAPGDRAIAFRELDRIVVQGREAPETMHEVAGYVDDLDQATHDCLGLYGEALAAYLAQDWDAAINRFEKGAAMEHFRPGEMPGIKTNPSLVMVERARVLKQDPPGDGWDGVYVMTGK